jgi:phytoene dehydrogenase-like protein
MKPSADIVVAGAGHNSLIAAAYLAKAGRRVLVLDARPVPGGGAATEELLLPGYKIDSCSTGHTLIHANPLFTRDELGLFAEHGLEYIEPDPVGHVAFPDGEHFTMWLDAERTIEEFARFSDRDADAYRRLLRDYEQVRSAFSRSNFTPPGMGPSLEDMLAEFPSGNVWLRRQALSAWDVIRHEFEGRHARAFMMWEAFQTLVSLDLPGSGALPYSIMYGRQQRSWTIPRGGSGQLTDALCRAIEKFGGEVVCGRTVTELILDRGRCIGVRTADGAAFVAREAVLSTIHVKHLIDMAPPDVWDEAFRYGVETLDVGIPAFVIYAASTAAPEFATPAGAQTAVSAGLAGWPEDVIRACRAIRDGESLAGPAAWMLVGTPTLADPARAPSGHHTVKVIVPHGHPPPRGAAAWDEVKEAVADDLLAQLSAAAPNFTPDTILARLVRSPVDIEAANAHMIHGTFHGGDRGVPYRGALRPAPGWAQHRTPIPGLYQTGGTTHPGGSITGGPGRNAAVVLLEDLGTSLEAVLGA